MPGMLFDKSGVIKIYSGLPVSIWKAVAYSLVNFVNEESLFKMAPQVADDKRFACLPLV